MAFPNSSRNIAALHNQECASATRVALQLSGQNRSSMNAPADNSPETEATFRPKMSNIIAGAIIGLGLLLGGISVAAVIVQRPDRPNLETADRVGKYVLIGMLGLGGPIAGITLLVWMKRLASHRVTVHSDGFTFIESGSTETCRWDELRKIEEIFTKEEMRVLKVPGASIKNIDRSFVLYRDDGHEFRFTVNTIDSIPKFARILEQARDRFQIKWERVEQ